MTLYIPEWRECLIMKIVIDKRISIDGLVWEPGEYDVQDEYWAQQILARGGRRIEGFYGLEPRTPEPDVPDVVSALERRRGRPRREAGV